MIYTRKNNILILSSLIFLISVLLSFATILKFDFLLYITYIVLAAYLLIAVKEKYLHYFVIFYFLFSILFHLPNQLKISNVDYSTYIELIIFFIALKIVIKRNVNIFSNKLFILILSYTFIGILSGIANSNQIVVIILFIKTPLLLYSIYIIFYHSTTNRFLKKIYPFIISYWFAQSFIIVLQNNLLLDKLYWYQGSFVDFFSGSMGWGSTQQISIFSSLMWLFLISNQKISKSIKILATVTFPLISIFASSGGGLIIILITMVTYLFLQSNFKKIYSILAISGVIITFYFIVPQISTKQHRGFIFYDTIIKGDYQFYINSQTTTEVGRIHMLAYLTNKLNDESSILIGKGPFAVRGSQYFESSSSVFKTNKLLSELQLQYGELGILGYLIILLIYIYPIMKLKINKTAKILSFFVLFAGSIYGLTFTTIFFAVNYWILLSLYKGEFYE